MNTRVYLDGKSVVLSDKNLVGEGGEATVYDISGGNVFKLYKRVNHPDFAGDAQAQHAVAQRLAELAVKLPAFPMTAPSRVVAPLKLGFDKAGSELLGYAMRFVNGAYPLLKLSVKPFRTQQAIGPDAVLGVFRDLHATVTALHKQTTVIGDFKNLNVLVANGTEAHIVDADSMQFGTFPCLLFTPRFVDPTLCRFNPDPTLVRPHNPDSDWYAFAVMLFQSLLFADPYDGIYRPANPKEATNDARRAARITVFNSGVQYPKPAIPFGMLPDDVLDRFDRMFVKDERGTFPLTLIDHMRWTTCTACGALHARANCPVCKITAPAVQVQTIIVRGRVTAKDVIRTRGNILRARIENGELRYFVQEGARITNEANMSAILPQEQPKFWIDGERLQRHGPFGPEFVGQVLENQTHIWWGNHLGFGFYRAGGLTIAFIFDDKVRAINDSVKLPRIRGTLVDATCTFSDHRVWIAVTTEDQGRLTHMISVVRDDGTLEASREAGDGFHVESMAGATAAGNFLLVPTDEGIVRVEPQGTTLAITKTFPDTEPFVSSADRLLIGRAGVYVICEDRIRVLTIT